MAETTDELLAQLDKLRKARATGIFDSELRRERGSKNRHA